MILSTYKNARGTGSHSASCIYPAVSGSVALLAQVVTNSDMCETFAGCSNPLPAAQQAAAAFAAQNLTAAVATVQSSHDTFWLEFWQRTTVSLGNVVVQNLWAVRSQASRKSTIALSFLRLIACDSRACSFSPGRRAARVRFCIFVHFLVPFCIVFQ